jgi:flagellar protein FliO/FliZ
MLWSYILKLFVLLPLVCGLMVGCLWLWRRLEARMPGQPANRMLKVQETMMLSPGLRLAVLEFEGKKLLVSVGRGGVTLIDKSGDSPK